jgi:sulfate/thiosulfate transport system ATP-binding protein
MPDSVSVSVRAEKIEKQFGVFAALRGVSLEVQPGELVALLGPSGSGKTTLLRVMAGLEQADSGTVHIGEIDAAQLSLRERRIGFVFQHYALFRHMNVADNIAFGLKARPRGARPSRAEIRKRVSDLLDLVQLSGLEKRFPAQLSGGQRQRVALARALAIEPRVLLLDEPFGALDAQVRKDLRRWLRDLHDRTGHTTVFVTHDQEEALELADRVAILNNGLIEQIGAPDDVYDAPATPFICRFLGETNEIPVSLKSGEAMLGAVALCPAQAANEPSIGDAAQALLFVRPHHVQVVEAEKSALQGVLSLIRRHGGLRRAEIAVPGLVKALDVDVTHIPFLRSGERVGLRIAQGHVFSGEGSVQA